MKTYYEIESVNKQIPHCNLLFALGEELSIRCRRVIDWHRKTNEIVVLEFDSTGDDNRDLALITNALRVSKNIEARTCAITHI